MNPSCCNELQRRPHTGVWFRAIHPSYWRSSLDTSHTSRFRSRYSAGPNADRPFEVLYLCENGTIALEETGAQFREPTSGRIYTAPVATLIVDVRVSLQSVIDLADVEQQELLSTNAQELTGDWRGYWSRHANSSVPRPTGISPTQALGQAVFDAGDIEAMFVLSAKLPDHRNLVIFPQRLRAGSSLTFANQISGESHTIP